MYLAKFLDTSAKLFFPCCLLIIFGSFEEYLNMYIFLAINNRE